MTINVANGLPDEAGAEAIQPASTASTYVYIVRCRDGTFYTGWTTDPVRRLKAHNAGRGAHYTRTRRPVELVYVEPHPDRRSAMRREAVIKKLSRDKKLSLIRQTSHRHKTDDPT
jgi:putative endonuclease